MANADAVMQTVKTRADPQAITQPTKAAPEIGMLKILTQLADGNQGHKLTGANTDQLGDNRQNQSRHDVV